MVGGKIMMLDVVEFTKELVKIPSITGNESNLAAFIKENIKSFFDTVKIDSKGNIVGKLFFSKERPTILFNGHIDTVDPGEMKEPFSGKIMDGDEFMIKGKIIYGRGTADMKGADAAYITAISKINKIENPPNIILHLVVKEEPGRGEGTKFVMDHIEERPDVAIVGEPTNLDICLGFRGWVQFQLEILGKTAHAGNPSQGINAVLKMRDFLNELQGYITTQELKVHPFLGKATCAVTNIECSPGRLSVIPDRCRLVFDSRYFPEETASDRKKELLSILNNLEKKDPDFKSEFKVLYDGMRPTFIQPNNHYVQILKEVIEKITGNSPNFISKVATCDSSYIVNDYGIPTIVFGPGFDSVAHTSSEYVPVDNLIIAEKVYLEFMDSIVQKGISK